MSDKKLTLYAVNDCWDRVELVKAPAIEKDDYYQLEENWEDFGSRQAIPKDDETVALSMSEAVNNFVARQEAIIEASEDEEKVKHAKQMKSLALAMLDQEATP